MADKQIAFTTVSGQWYWRGSSPLDCQTGTLVTMPEQGLLTTVEFAIGGLDYVDPVYGYQYEQGYARAAIWRASDGAILSTSGYQSLLPKDGGSPDFISFDLTNILVPAGENLIVGFWRKSNSTGYSTQWDYNSSATGSTTYAHDIYGSGSGPEPFRISRTYSNRSLLFKLHYTNGGRAKVWDGHTWVPKNGYVWNGTAWVKDTTQVWNGTAWTEAVE